ncbi:unnamed protein product [Moneuplotes crassus]|uniref:Uncharacterized protein n=1 Tax=Euplotes crassus TaxID=5936 RepID=A0AAD1UK38_EUPCR|nr:unnamed protein product [Moneuplotes crassus]
MDTQDDLMNQVLDQLKQVKDEGARLQKEIEQMREENAKIQSEKDDLAKVIEENEKQLQDLKEENPEQAAELTKEEEALYDDGEGWPDDEGDDGQDDVSAFE